MGTYIKKECTPIRGKFFAFKVALKKKRIGISIIDGFLFKFMSIPLIVGPNKHNGKSGSNGIGQHGVLQLMVKQSFLP